VQARLDLDGRALDDPLDDVEEDLRLLAVRQVDRRVEDHGHLRLLAGLHVLEADAEVDPRDLGLVRDRLGGQRGDDLPDLAGRALGVGERREQRAGQRERGALHGVVVLRGVPPHEVHEVGLVAARPQGLPDGRGVQDVHADDDGVRTVHELQRDDVEPLAVPRPRADELRAGEHAEQAPDQRGPRVVPGDVPVGVDLRRLVPHRDLHRCSPAPVWTRPAAAPAPVTAAPEPGPASPGSRSTSSSSSDAVIRMP